MKKVSIIVPVYNVEKYIENCIKSLMNQTYKNIEIILVDDGSSDESYNICKNYSKKYSFIKSYHKKNGGPSSARNYGIEKASGKYICFVDSDDSVKEDYIEKLIENEADLVMGGFVELYGKNKKIKKICDKKQDFSNEEIYVKLLEAAENDKFNSPCCKIFKKSIIENNHLRYDESLNMGEDLIFNIRYLKYCKTLTMIPDCLYFYNMTVGGSLTKKFELTRWNTEKNVYLEYKKLYEFYDIYEKYKNKIDCMLLMGAKKTLYILGLSNLSYKDSLKYINEIIYDDKLNKVLKNIKVENKFSKLLYILIKNKKTRLIYFIFKIRVKI